MYINGFCKNLPKYMGMILLFVFLHISSSSAENVRLQFATSNQNVIALPHIHGARSRDWARASYENSFGDIDFGLSLLADGQERSFSADGSYADLNFGNWKLGIGAVDRLWSFSPHTSLILSRNARPVPSVYIKKDELTRFSSPLLSWVGRWNGEVFLGLDSQSRAFEDVYFFGARLVFEPFSDLQVELLRSAQFTGGAASFGGVVLGDTNEGTAEEANQMAGVGASYRWDRSRFYVQAVGEDEAGGLPSCWFYLVGAERETLINVTDAVLSIEVVDTRVGFTDGGFCGPNTAYNNGRHPYTYEGAVMGAPIDSEGKSVNLRGTHDLNTIDVDWGLGHYVINDSDAASHRLSNERVTGYVAHLGLKKQFADLQLGGRLTYQGFNLNQDDVKRGLAVSLFAERQF
jgi:hypothetical protein